MLTLFLILLELLLLTILYWAHRRSRTLGRGQHALAMAALRSAKSYLAGNRLARAKESAEEARELFELCADREGEARTLLVLSRIRSRLADKPGALASLDAIQPLTAGVSTLRFEVAFSRAEILLEHGDIHGALRAYQVALEMPECPSDFSARDEAMLVRSALVRGLHQKLSYAREAVSTGAFDTAARLYEELAATACSPAFQPLSLERYPARLGQYAAIADLEMETLKEAVQPV